MSSSVVGPDSVFDLWFVYLQASLGVFPPYEKKSPFNFDLSFSIGQLQSHNTITNISNIHLQAAQAIKTFKLPTYHTIKVRYCHMSSSKPLLLFSGVRTLLGSQKLFLTLKKVQNIELSVSYIKLKSQP